ncbi:hypothetical protein AYL99_07348 [Fonsecaea erecta]|uniref:Uncharacterized protein n=1 Tax=Fonsecaea erecta TaxID=1367422 RepID=A0A178ZER4_9EURO|nr:hypothetical protein AYL99_07348 [Fonsecaea erecta]OAP58258.1 hypothetical protein AYL99_07348 [Fonsecaea erecta]
MRGYHQHSCDPVIPLPYQIIDDDGGANQSKDRIKAVDFIDLRYDGVSNDGSCCGWLEDVPPPSHEHHHQPAPHQAVRHTPQLISQRPELTVDGLTHLTLGNLVALLQQQPHQIAGPQDVIDVVDNPVSGGHNSAAASTFQRKALPVDRQFSQTIQGYGDISQRGPELPPIRNELRREDTQLPGEPVRRKFDIPQAKRQQGFIKYSIFQCLAQGLL